jgi:phosphoribosylaminoimidazolecarboxamide formyltransferase/IMP cyclohydrolase
MLRAAAKNFLRVAAVCNPSDYERVAREISDAHGCLSLQTRYELAAKVFAATNAYDHAIAGHLGSIGAPQLARQYRASDGEADS